MLRPLSYSLQGAEQGLSIRTDTELEQPHRPTFDVQLEHCRPLHRRSPNLELEHSLERARDITIPLSLPAGSFRGWRQARQSA